MHHNRSLLPDVEVLSSVMVKTSRCSTKLLFVVLNFYSWIFFIILTKFLNFKQISEFWPNFWISKKLQNINQISEFQQNFGNSTKFQNFKHILSSGIHVVKSSYGWHYPGQIFPQKLSLFSELWRPFLRNFCFESLSIVFFWSIMSAGVGKTNFWTCHLRLSTSKVQLKGIVQLFFSVAQISYFG